MVNRKNATRCIYKGKGYKSRFSLDKYPHIKTGDKGYFIEMHKWEQEEHPGCVGFYPDKWGGIYYFVVNRDEVEAIIEKQTELSFSDMQEA